MLNRFISILIIVALCLDYLPLVPTASTMPTSLHPNSRLLEQAASPLSDAGSSDPLDPAQSQLSQSPTAQDQPIRVKTELINLRAVITDKSGRPITDLKKEDFELTEPFSAKPAFGEAIATQIH